MLRRAGMTWLLVEPRRQAVELHTAIEEPEDMKTSDRGLKHVCPACESKYYDLRREVVTCPRCGAKPRAAKVPAAARPARKTGGTTFWRYP
jgi:ssDNA-binding Zn-finger/Zn-ribbon topoisomerase 1